MKTDQDNDEVKSFLNPRVWGLGNVVAGLLVVAWLYCDSRFEAALDWWQFAHENNQRLNQIRDMGDWPWLTLRNQVLALLGLAVVISVFFMFGRLWFGRPRNRTTQNWLALTAIVALWLGILVGWQDIAWAGKQSRLHALLRQFDQMVDELQREWPKRDGKLESLGPFMAYPAHRPTTLILLTLPVLNHNRSSVAAVEGGGDVLRFELVGPEKGDWLEWHPSGNAPGSFVSGIGELYQIERSQNLTAHWHLVRYRL